MKAGHTINSDTSLVFFRLVCGQLGHEFLCDSSSLFTSSPDNSPQALYDALVGWASGANYAPFPSL